MNKMYIFSSFQSHLFAWFVFHHRHKNMASCETNSENLPSKVSETGLAVAVNEAAAVQSPAKSAKKRKYPTADEDATTLLRLLKRDNFDSLVFRAVEKQAGIRLTSKKIGSVVCNQDVVVEDTNLKNTLLAAVCESIGNECVGEKFFLRDCGFELGPNLMGRVAPFKSCVPNDKDESGSEDSEEGLDCIEQNHVYQAIRNAATSLMDTEDEDDEDDDEDESEDN